MIVGCKECKTKYRFDESLVDGDGAWVRCSRCKALFFLEIPTAEKTPPPVYYQGKEDIRIPPLGKTQEPIENDVKPDLGQTSRLFMDVRDKTPDTPEMEHPEQSRREEIEPDPQIEATAEDLMESEGDLQKEDEPEKVASQEGDEDRKPRAVEKSARSKGMQWLLLIVLLFLGGLYLWFFSEIGRQAADYTSSVATTLIEKIHGAPLKKEDVGPAQVDLMDVRQRLVANASLGIIRVVEGVAVNQSSHPMTRIKVRGEIVGEGDVLLGNRESYCGNLLTADELAALTEEQFQKELSNPQGSDVSNDRIAPKGQIPFMIVFTREPPGVMKAYVIPVGAERLLP
jgi:predicted Zn finger-like uncharacterized protein